MSPEECYHFWFVRQIEGIDDGSLVAVWGTQVTQNIGIGQPKGMTKLKLQIIANILERLQSYRLHRSPLLKMPLRSCLTTRLAAIPLCHPSSQQYSKVALTDISAPTERPRVENQLIPISKVKKPGGVQSMSLLTS